ncbi:WLM domain-containing protein [Blastocladiella britannica]|nr:WLM domain-containing protein [Blastocladiella britannica]
MSAANELIGEISALKRRPRHDDALAMLQRAATIVHPLMKARGWRIGVLREFFPTDPCLLGLNINRGMEVRVRLRPDNAPDSFLDPDDILGTLLHELAHNRISPHNAKFHALVDELKDEVYAMRARGIDLPSFTSGGRVLGSRNPGTAISGGQTVRNPVPAVSAAAAAARVRLQTLGLMGGPRKLGSSSSSEIGGGTGGRAKASARAMAAQAAFRRQMGAVQCGTGRPPREVVCLDDSDEEGEDGGVVARAGPSSDGAVVVVLPDSDDDVGDDDVNDVITVVRVSTNRAAPSFPSIRQRPRPVVILDD